MNFPDYSTAGKSPRREVQLQGPRPTPLKVRKDSHKIRKPPVAPQNQQSQSHQPSQQQPRPPVIIYTVSPKIIHTHPSEFMNLVQRLTGPSATCPSTPPGPPSPASSFFQDGGGGGAISPAARLASVEKTRSPEGKRMLKSQGGDFDNYDIGVEGVEISADVERLTGLFPGILSPGPGSLPPIPPNYFAQPTMDPNPMGFFQDFSPALHSARNYIMDALFMPSPSNFLSSHIITSPTPSPDLFNNFFDF